MLCLNCNTQQAIKKFCSRSCAAIFNNKNYPKRTTEQTRNRQCKYCSKKLGPVITYNNMFCGAQCFRAFQFERVTAPRIETGTVSRSTTLKSYLTKIRGYKCSDCGNTGTHNNRRLVLQLDHIDGNSDNNLPANLRLLCPNCHTQTETFTSRQKKETRRNRYLRRIKGYA